MVAPETLRAYPKLQEYVDGPGYLEATETRTIESYRKEFGILTNDSFEATFKRPTRWQVHGDQIQYYAPIEVKKGEDPPPFETPADLRRYGVKITHVITAEELARHPLSPGVLKTVLVDKRIEDNLPWFTLNLFEENTEVMGVNRAAGQWVVEEREHSNVESLILRTVPILKPDGSIGRPMTKQELYDDYYDTQMNIWKPPFETYTENIAYPYFQERSTYGNYMALANKMKEEGNLAAYYAMVQVAQDESWHGASYRDMLIQHHKLKPEETIRAVARVAWHFRMPSMHLMRDRIQDTKDVIRTTGYNKEQIEKMLRSALVALPFFPREYIEPLVTGYWEEETRRVRTIMYALLREQVQARKAANDVGRVDNSNGRQNGSSKEVTVFSS